MEGIIAHVCRTSVYNRICCFCVNYNKLVMDIYRIFLNSFRQRSSLPPESFWTLLLRIQIMFVNIFAIPRSMVEERLSHCLRATFRVIGSLWFHYLIDEAKHHLARIGLSKYCIHEGLVCGLEK